MPKPRIELNNSRNKQFFVNVTAGNNKKLVHSETFKTRQGAKNNITALKKIIPGATVVDNTKKIKK